MSSSLGYPITQQEPHQVGQGNMGAHLWGVEVQDQGSCSGFGCGEFGAYSSEVTFVLLKHGHLGGLEFEYLDLVVEVWGSRDPTLGHCS